MIYQQVVIYCIRMIEVRRVPIIERHVLQVAIVKILLNEDDFIGTHRFENSICDRCLAGTSATTNADDHKKDVLCASYFVLCTLCFVLCRFAESVRATEITRLGKTSKHEEQSTKNSFSEPRNNSSQQFGKLRAHALAGGDDLIVIDRAVRNAGREVRNA